MTIARIRIALQGSALVGPGLMTFYSRNLTPSLPASCLKLVQGIGAAIATGVTFTVPNSGDTIDESTGALMGSWTGTGGGTAASSGTGNFTLGSGALLTWHTGGVVAGHRVTGRTFCVPLANGCFDSSGHVAPSIVTMITTPATQFITDNGGDLVVWMRPRKAGTGKNHDLPARAGAAVPVVTASVSNVPTGLRSRRV